jgi:DNA polymerase I-like protein with 3'-5' exonuclease and polymerase domains
MNIRYNVVDIETSIKNRGEEAVGKMKASSFCEENDIVLIGSRAYDIDDFMAFEDHNNGVGIFSPNSGEDIPNYLTAKVDVLVGQNIKFDMLYLMRDYSKIKEWLENGGKVWDTQLAQYILEGQQKMFPSLDYTAPLYGGTVKDDRIKAFWDEGIDTEDIPVEMLTEYLVNDVLNTEKIYLGQMQEAFDRGMLPLIESQMEGLVATIEMEYNGMYFDREIAAKETLRLHAEMQEVEANVIEIMEKYIDVSKIDINPYSNDQLSVVLFGGALKYRGAEDIIDEYGIPVVYKSGLRKGEIKTRKIDMIYSTKGFQSGTDYSTELKKKGFYATNDKVLKTLKDKHIASNRNAIVDFITMLLELRKVKKDLTTYFIGYSDLTWPDGRIHGSLHHCSTATGRLSSASPNLQNVSSGD